MPIHGIPSKGIKAYSAFHFFNSDLKSVHKALSQLKLWMEKILKLDAESCLKRLESLKLFPKLNRPPSPEFKLTEAQRMIGKQIETVEFGKEEFCEDCHQCEAIIFHFTDGTAMTIRIGSNAGNIADEYSQIKPSEFQTDLMLFWAGKLQSSE
jgi:hypothetical protein